MTETFTTFETGYSFISTIKERKTYYSSAWTGRISKEEQAEINLKKIICEQMEKNIDKQLHDLFHYGFSVEKNNKRIDPKEYFITKAST